MRFVLSSIFGIGSLLSYIASLLVICGTVFVALTDEHFARYPRQFALIILFFVGGVVFSVLSHRIYKG